jgi:hypothetical protein
MEPGKKDAEKIFSKILKEAEDDPNILAFWLGGSRGKGIITHNESDYDCTMIVKDEVLQEYKDRYEKIGDPMVDLGVLALDEFKNGAAWGSDSAWQRYAYVEIKPALVDKTGEIQKIFNEKAGIPEIERERFIGRALDYYINEVYRSLKCFYVGQVAGARLEAAESVLPLLNIVFAIHGRLRPYYKYYEWELKNYPLTKLNISGEEFTKQVMVILESADIETQKKLLLEMETVTRKEGYGEVWDSWGAMLAWMKNFKR